MNFGLLALAVIKQAIIDKDSNFFKSEWFLTLQDLANVYIPERLYNFVKVKQDNLTDELLGIKGLTVGNRVSAKKFRIRYNIRYDDIKKIIKEEGGIFEEDENELFIFEKRYAPALISFYRYKNAQRLKKIRNKKKGGDKKD